MNRSSAILKLAIAAALAAPLAALGQSAAEQQSSQQQSAQQPAAQADLVIITVTPVQQRMLDQQRRESIFRTLDADANGEISMAEAGVNTELLQAFNKLDRNSDNIIERQEFTRVHVRDSSSQAQSSARTSRSADESWQLHGSKAQRSAGSGQSESAAAGATTGEPSGQLPSRSIEERARGSYPGESVPPNTPGQPTR